MSHYFNIIIDGPPPLLCLQEKNLHLFCGLQPCCFCTNTVHNELPSGTGSYIAKRSRVELSLAELSSSFITSSAHLRRKGHERKAWYENVSEGQHSPNKPRGIWRTVHATLQVGRLIILFSPRRTRMHVNFVECYFYQPTACSRAEPVHSDTSKHTLSPAGLRALIIYFLSMRTHTGAQLKFYSVYALVGFFT